MATSVIDALVITLGLDASDYQKKRKEVSSGLKETREDASKTAKEMEAQGKRAASFFSSIKNEVLALAGVSFSIAGISAFVRNTTSGLQQLAVQSQALGMSARQLDGWSKAAQAAGSSAEKITGTLGSFQNFLQNYRSMGKGSGPISDALAMLSGDTGVTFDPANMDSSDLMRAVEQALKKERNGDRARQLGLMLGLDDATIQAMRSGNLTKDASHYTSQSGVTDADVRNAQRFNREWTALQQKLEKTGYIIYGSLSPYVEEFTRYLTGLASWMEQHPKEIKAGIESFFGSISSAVKICDEAAQAVGGWKNAILLLVGATVGGKLLGFIGLFSSALLGLTRLPVPPWLLGAAAYANYAVNDKENIKDSAESSWRYTKGNIGDFLRGIGINTDFGRNPNTIIGTPDAALDIPGVAPQQVLTGDKAQRTLDELNAGQNDAMQADKRVSDESRDQRNKTNDILGKILEFFVPSASADTLEPNIASSASGDTGVTSVSGVRGIRNNNPGNLNYVGQAGAVLERPGGRFARFETPFDGLKAMGRQLMRYFTGKTTGSALDSVKKIISTWAPGKENDTAAYIQSVSRALGVAPDARLNLHDPQLLSMLMTAITRHENGAVPYSNDLIGRAAREASMGIRPGAGMTVERNLPPRQTVQSGSQYHIGNVTVQSPANRVDQLTEDLGRSAQNRARALGFDTRQTS